METPELVEVQVDSFQARPDIEHRAVVLRATGEDRVLPIWIGPFEADAIAMALAGQQPQRPMTHDLTMQLLETLKTQVRRVVVNKIIDNTFYAEITLAQGEQAHLIDARPSDALALAVRAGTPVYVARAILEAAGGPDNEAFWTQATESLRKWQEQHGQSAEAMDPQPEGD